jgi:hypothetical protein
VCAGLSVGVVVCVCEGGGVAVAVDTAVCEGVAVAVTVPVWVTVAVGGGGTQFEPSQNEPAKKRVPPVQLACGA